MNCPYTHADGEHFPYKSCEKCENTILDDGLYTCRLQLEKLTSNNEIQKKGDGGYDM